MAQAPLPPDAPVPPAPPATPAPAAPPARRPLATRVLLWLGGGVAVLLLLFVAYTWIALTYTYSDGERAGYVQKFSRKGWICKTWEGDLALVNLPGQPADIFRFSVRDEAVAQRINTLVGRRVALSYEQHVGIPTSCFGDTEYFVTAVRAVE